MAGSRLRSRVAIALFGIESLKAIAFSLGNAAWAPQSKSVELQLEGKKRTSAR